VLPTVPRMFANFVIGSFLPTQLKWGSAVTYCV
jgi:hypothetical protein